MEQSVGRMWMIGVSIEMARQQLGLSRTIHWSTAIHCSLGEYSDFEEDVLSGTRS